MTTLLILNCEGSTELDYSHWHRGYDPRRILSGVAPDPRPIVRSHGPNRPDPGSNTLARTRFLSLI